MTPDMPSSRKFYDLAAEYSTARAALTEWNQKCCLPPLLQEEIDTIAGSGVTSRENAIGVRHWSRTGHEFVERLQPAANEMSLAYWLKLELPPPDFLQGAVFSTTTRALIFAPTGVGKTQVGMAAAMRMAAGVDFLGWKGQRPCRVLYIDGEMSPRLFQQRLKDEAKRLGSMPEGFFASTMKDSARIGIR